MSAHESGRAGRAAARDYTRLLRASLLGCAILLALLPIPVTWFRLLPAYETHARFLAIYTPVICLLLLAYLLYVRDALARVMFVNILNPLPEPDPYYRVRAGERLLRWLRWAQATVLALLPAVLLATSFYCLVRYTERLRFSAAAAGELSVEGEEVGRIATASDRRPGDAAPGDSPAPARRKGATDTPADPGPEVRPVPPSASYEAVVSPARERILRTAQIDAIPFFTELTVLYIGIFASALLAVILMAMKEHAKAAMGLSEQEMVIGRYAGSDEGLEGPVLASDHGD